MPLIQNEPTIEQRLEKIEARLDAIEDKQMTQIDALCRRLDGLWWKIGLISGVVSILLAKVFGSNVASIFNGII